MSHAPIASESMVSRVLMLVMLVNRPTLAESGGVSISSEAPERWPASSVAGDAQGDRPTGLGDCPAGVGVLVSAKGRF